MTIDENGLFVDGEEALGRYTAVILRQTSSGNWESLMLQLDALVTNYRLLLRPHRKKYRPASLPARYIKDVEMTKRGRYHCAAISLTSGELLCVALQTGRLNNLIDDLNAMRPAGRKYRFDDTIAREDIQRLITFFGRAPLADTTATPTPTTT